MVISHQKPFEKAQKKGSAQAGPFCFVQP